MSSAIATFSGKLFDPWDIDPNAICIEDIAHSLSMQCRFNGQCPRFYSVAQHCCVLSGYFEQRGRHNMALVALLHDAAEAYVGGIPSPFKSRLPDHELVERNVLHVIMQKFAHHGWTRSWYDDMHELKRYDSRICVDEALMLWSGHPLPEWAAERAEREMSFDWPLALYIEWTAHRAEREYLMRFHRLRHALNDTPHYVPTARSPADPVA